MALQNQYINKDWPTTLRFQFYVSLYFCIASREAKVQLRLVRRFLEWGRKLCTLSDGSMVECILLCSLMYRVVASWLMSMSVHSYYEY